MSRALVLAYGVVAYVVFLLTFLYAVGFVENVGVPKSIDSGLTGPVVPSLLVDAILLGLFAVQHSVMARPAFKRWWTRFVPQPVERSTYVLLASLLLILVFWQWRPITGVAWAVPGLASRVVSALSWLGWGVVLVSTFFIDHFDLFGLRHVWLYYTGRTYTPPAITERGLYRACRHPIMLGFILAFVATPVMTWGHLLFAGLTTGYILVAIQLEERDLVAHLGKSYEDYRARVPMLVPLLRRRQRPA